MTLAFISKKSTVSMFLESSLEDKDVLRLYSSAT